jgi:HD-like signal output (HDOD) protein/anti-sigma regulatory factor (Ser/Thr protein kinase)
VEDHRKAKLLKKIVDSEGLPSLSPLAIQLVELAADDQSSAHDLAAVIEKDPSLTTRLLRLVGSALYARAEPITSISQAVVLVGFKRLRVMALSLSLRDTFPMGKKGSMDYDHFWRTSLYRALIAQDFCESAQLSKSLHSDEAFVGGLISEIGLLMLYNVCTDEMRKSFPGGGLPLEEAVAWEEENLGVNHREVGGLILRRWRFSDHVVESQKCFGEEALEPDKPILCQLVELARRATEIVFGQRTDLYALQQLAQTLLRLEPEAVNTTLSETFNRVEDLAEQLLLEVDSQNDILRVMERANQALARINVSMETSLQGLLDHVSGYDQSLTQISEEMAQDRTNILQNTLDAVAHEIRNPLMAIAGFAKRLAHERKEDDRGRQYARIIAQESSRLEQTLREVMDYCQDYTPAPAEHDLVSVVNKALDEFQGVFRENKVDVVRNFSSEVVMVPVDINGITEVLHQLFKNSISMIGQASGTVTVSIQPSRQTQEVCISVSDNGRPVPEDVRDCLIGSNLSTKTFGWGLGLPMARKILEAHSGRIELKAEEGVGNTVNVCIPISQPAY